MSDQGLGEASGQEARPQPGTSVAEIMERLRALPVHLQADSRRFYVEATSDETRAPLMEFYRQTREAESAAQAWAKAVGADGFYPPGQSWGTEPRSVSAVSFKRENVPGGPAWLDAGRHYVSRPGYVAKRPSKRPAGKAITAELEALPKFPAYDLALSHLGAITDLCTENGSEGVGHSDGKMHFAVPFEIGDRFFISAVNHNYDISERAQQAARYLASENPEWAPSLDFEGDPIAWRPAAGWTFLSKAEVDFLIAGENLRRSQAATSPSASIGGS